MEKLEKKKKLFARIISIILTILTENSHLTYQISTRLPLLSRKEFHDISAFADTSLWQTRLYRKVMIPLCTAPPLTERHFYYILLNVTCKYVLLFQIDFLTGHPRKHFFPF